MDREEIVLVSVKFKDGDKTQTRVYVFENSDQAYESVVKTWPDGKMLMASTGDTIYLAPSTDVVVEIHKLAVMKEVINLKTHEEYRS